MPPTGFEPAIPASERPYTLALDRSAIAIGSSWIAAPQKKIKEMVCANVDWTFKAFQYLCFVALEYFSCKGTFLLQPSDYQYFEYILL